MVRYVFHFYDYVNVGDQRIREYVPMWAISKRLGVKTGFLMEVLRNWGASGYLASYTQEIPGTQDPIESLRVWNYQKTPGLVNETGSIQRIRPWGKSTRLVDDRSVTYTLGALA